ncbi:hypothetical protein SALWKB12_0252 [Snodgrassella communis]|nr:hypothetical protein SALWKB12_0252 [Snodgrassella communis]
MVYFTSTSPHSNVEAMAKSTTNSTISSVILEKPISVAIDLY